MGREIKDIIKSIERKWRRIKENRKKIHFQGIIGIVIKQQAS